MRKHLKPIIAALAAATLVALPVAAQEGEEWSEHSPDTYSFEPSDRMGHSDSNIQTAEGSNGTDTVVLGGADRYETAALIARSVANPDSTEVMYIANGETVVDALVIGVTNDRSNKMLLVKRDEVPQHTRDALCKITHAKLVFLGGDAAISPETRTEVANLTRNYVTNEGGAACHVE